MWGEQSRNDKELGGQKFDDNLATAQKGVAAFASDGFKRVLDETGLGNHPEVLRHFYTLGQKVSEDKLVFGGATAGDKSMADRFYGSN